MEAEDIRSVKHCIICQKHIYVDHEGTLCGLTNARADFNGNCKQFVFRDEIEAFVEQLKEDLKEAERTQISLRRQMIIWFISGLVLLAAGITIWTMPWNHGAVHILPISLIIIGIIILPHGAWEFFPHQMRLKAKHHETHEFMVLIKHYKNELGLTSTG